MRHGAPDRSAPSDELGPAGKSRAGLAGRRIAPWGGQRDALANREPVFGVPGPTGGNNRQRPMGARLRQGDGGPRQQGEQRIGPRPISYSSWGLPSVLGISRACAKARLIDRRQPMRSVQLLGSGPARRSAGLHPETGGQGHAWAAARMTPRRAGSPPLGLQLSQKAVANTRRFGRGGGKGNGVGCWWAYWSRPRFGKRLVKCAPGLCGRALYRDVLGHDVSFIKASLQGDEHRELTPPVSQTGPSAN